MKILIFSHLYYPNVYGGAEKNTQMVAEELAKRNLDVVVVTTSDRDYIDNVNGIKVYYLKTTNLYWALHSKAQAKYKKPLWHLLDSYNFFMAKKIETIIKTEIPSVALTNTLSGFSVAVWGLLKKHGIPLMHVMHDHYLLCLKTTMFSDKGNCDKQCWQCKVFSIPKKYASRYVDYIVGVSHYILNRHLGKGYFKQAKYATRLFNIFDIKSDRPKKKLTGDIIFGFVGQISDGKGIELLLEQLSDMEDVILYIYGKSQLLDYEANLKRKYEGSSIKFMGFKDNLEDVYNNLDILIVPSLWNDSAPRVIVEAYSFGIPVIASNRGGISEFVEEGKTGFIFDPNDPSELKEKIKWFQANKEQIELMSEFCLAKVKDFSKEKLINEYIKSFHCLVGD